MVQICQIQDQYCLLLVDRFDDVVVVPVVVLLFVSVVVMMNLGNGVEMIDADHFARIADQLQAAECVAIN